MSALAIEVVPIEQLGQRSAQRIAADLRDALDVRGRATLALSGGSTPVPMYAELARADLPWDLINVFQVDERIAPDGDPARNIAAIRAALVDNGPVPEHHLRAIRVVSVDVETEAERYGAMLRSVTGTIDPPIIDVIQLGLGADGHTASLVPDDPVLRVVDRPVAVTGDYQGHRRMTLTAPVLSAARSVVWMVAGADKVGAVERLLGSDPTVPASLVQASSSTLVVDEAAAPSNA